MNALPRTLTLVGVLAAVLGFAPGLACATSASVSAALRPDGSVVATARGSFAPCPNPDYSRVLLQRDKSQPYPTPLCSVHDVSCTGIEDRGRLAQGAHEYTATAFDCTGSAESPSVLLTIDNTPAVTVTGPGGVVTGPFDITGTATFKPTLSATKGTVSLYVNNAAAPTVVKTCLTETCAFSYREVTGGLYALPPGGPYTVELIARTKSNDAMASDKKTFRVASCRDNDGAGFFGADPVLCPPPLGDDCNDNDATIYPGAPEQCNGKDNNCNGVSAEGACDGACVPFASSLNPATGALRHSQGLFAARGGTGLPTQVALLYTSLDVPRSALGTGWMHSYELALTELGNGSVIVRQGDGTRRVYHPTPNGYRAQAGDYATLTKTNDGWQLVEKSGLAQLFDREGHLLALTDRNGNRLTFQYVGGQLSTVRDAAGRTTTFAYTPEHRLSAIVDPNGNRHTFSYQGTFLTAVTTVDTLLGTRNWAYTYTTGGLLLSKTDPNGQTTRYTYDAANRMSSSTTPDGQVQSVTYDPTAPITRLTAGDGGVWSYRYDPRLGVLTHTTDPLGNTTVYTYDANKQRIARLDPDGSVSRVTYDAQGNVTSTTDALGQITTYTTNAFGQVTSLTDPRGDRTVYTYDATGNLLTSTDPSGALTRYAYDAQGRLLQRTDALGQRTTFTYDARGHLASITDPTGATTQFTADLAGNRLAQVDAQGNTTRFAYDSLNQLLQMTDPLGHATAYTYDAAGNRLAQVDAQGHLTTYAYNYRGQVTAVQDARHHVTALRYGPHGCPACGSGRGNPLTEVTDATGQTTRYAYDRAGRLVTATTPPGTATTSAYDAAGRSVTRIDATGATLTSAYERYTHGPGIDEPLLLEQDGQPYVYHPSDAITSV